MENFCIRKARPEDCNDIQRLTCEGIGIWGEGLENNLKPWYEVISSTAHIASRITSEDCTIWVAENESGIIGTVYLEGEGDEVYMGGLYCSVRGLGLGTKLLRYSMDRAIETGANSMTCHIYEHNVPSVSLIKKHGAFYDDEETIADVRYVTYRFDIEQALKTFDERVYA